MRKVSLVMVALGAVLLVAFTPLTSVAIAVAATALIMVARATR